MNGNFYNKRTLAIGIILLAAALLLPFFIRDTYIIHLVIMSLVWGCVVTNWNLTLGYGGMFHIAQPTFLAVGAYGAGIATNSFGLSPWLALPAAGLAAGAASIVIGMPSLRVKGIYLILLTFAFHFALSESVFHFGSFTGGSIGLTVPTYKLGAIKFSPLNLTAYYYMAVILTIVSLALTIFTINADIGKALMATRDSEVLAGCCGINIYRHKMIMFSGAAMVTGVVGGFYASYLMAIGPELFSFSLIVNSLGMIVIGGMGTVLGPVTGSFIITFLSELFADLEAYRPIIVGAIIMLMLIFAPKGIVDQVHRLFGKILGKPGAA